MIKVLESGDIKVVFGTRGLTVFETRMSEDGVFVHMIALRCAEEIDHLISSLQTFRAETHE